MTREEIIEAISDDKMMPYIEPYQLSDIVDFVIKNYKPSLPSNLDVAAKKIAYGVCKQLPNGTEKDSIVYYAILAAKVGAEWMAGQGATKEAVIGIATEEISINVSQKTLNELDLCPGDKVVFTIRKK